MWTVIWTIGLGLIQVVHQLKTIFLLDSETTEHRELS